MDPPLLSVCLIVRDEEERLPACLDAVVPIADEVVVADTGSRDRTAEIARARGARVVQHAWADDFSAARNAALGAATGAWVLSVDADERLEPTDAARLRERLRHASDPAFTVEVVSPQGGERVEVAHLVRLFRRDPGVRYEGRIHETVLGSICRGLGRDSWMPPRSGLRLHHSGYEPALRAARGKHERNRRLLLATIADAPDDPGPRFLFARENVAVAGGDVLDLPDTREALDVMRPGLARLLALPPRGITEPALTLGARLAVASGDLAAAAAWAEEARARFGATARGCYAEGELALARGDLGAARSAFRAAVTAPDGSAALPVEAALRERWAPVRVRLCEVAGGRAHAAAGFVLEELVVGAFAALRGGDTAATVKAAAAALSADREDPRGWWFLGFVLRSAGDPRAPAMGATALRLAPGWRPAESLASGADLVHPAGLLALSRFV